MANISRRQLADYAATQILNDDKQIIAQLTAYLKETGRTKEADLLIQDISLAMQDKGMISAEVSSCHPLDDATRNDLKKLLSERYNSKNINISETTDSSLLGGIKIKTAKEEFDGSLKKKINRLKMTEA